jgi:hypothetical protein
VPKSTVSYFDMLVHLPFYMYISRIIIITDSGDPDNPDAASVDDVSIELLWW